MNYSVILNFLGELNENNNREWFEKNKPAYLKAKKEFENIVEQLINRLAELDPELADLKPKQCIFRLYRDVRFSKDKRPYKNNFGAAFARGGRKSNHALYYIPLQPGNSFLASGIYHPPADILKSIRQEIEYNGADFKKIIDAKNFKEDFKELQGEKLKRPPKGFDGDDPNIELLKFKSYLAVHQVDDKIILRDNYLDFAIKIYKSAKPLYEFINHSFE